MRNAGCRFERNRDWDSDGSELNKTSIWKSKVRPSRVVIIRHDCAEIDRGLVIIIII